MAGLPAQGGGGPKVGHHVKISDQPIDVKIEDQPIDVNVLNAINADITDRCSRLLGQLCFGGVTIDPRDRNWTLDFATDQVDVSGSSVSISGTPDVNVTDRANRLLGITYGSQGAQLQQRLGTLELLVQLRNAGIDIDPTQIRPLTFATDSVNVSGSAVTTTNVPTTPINDFNTGLNVSSGSSSTHAYTATGNFKLTSIQASASGAIKIEVKSGASGSETIKLVAFTTETNLTAQLRFHEELQLTMGQRLQVIITNRELQSMDVFSTILGFNS